MQSHFLNPSLKTALEFGPRPILQPVQKFRDLVGLHNFCLQSHLEAMPICDRVFRTWGGDFGPVGSADTRNAYPQQFDIQPVPIRPFLFVIAL